MPDDYYAVSDGAGLGYQRVHFVRHASRDYTVLAAVDHGLLYPLMQRLRNAADLLRDRNHRRPSRWMITLVIEHHPFRSPADLGRKIHTPTWSPGDGSAANADAFTEVQQQFRTGDRIQFTRNNYEAKRLNGRTAEVVAMNPDEGILVVRSKNGKRQALDMANVADRHIRPG